MLKAGIVNEGYCLSIPCGGFLYSISVWSFNAHSV